MYRGKNIIIDGTMEIFYKDLPSDKNWNQYYLLCKALKGEGWRLPTLDELRYMYDLSTLGILNFNKEYYWSSSLDNNFVGVSAYSGHRECISFKDGSTLFHNTLISKNVSARPVRSLLIDKLADFRPSMDI